MNVACYNVLNIIFTKLTCFPVRNPVLRGRVLFVSVVKRSHKLAFDVTLDKRHVLICRYSVTTLPPYLFNGTPVLDHPDRVIPFDEADR